MAPGRPRVQSWARTRTGIHRGEIGGGIVTREGAAIK